MQPSVHKTRSLQFEQWLKNWLKEPSFYLTHSWYFTASLFTVFISQSSMTSCDCFQRNTQGWLLFSANPRDALIKWRELINWLRRHVLNTFTFSKLITAVYWLFIANLRSVVVAQGGRDVHAVHELHTILEFTLTDNTQPLRKLAETNESVFISINHLSMENNKQDNDKNHVKREPH